MTWAIDEMFRDSIREFVEHLEAAGVPTDRRTRPTGMFHVYPILMPWADHSRRVYRDMGEFVRVQITKASSDRTEIARRTRHAAEALGPVDEDAAPMKVTSSPRRPAKRGTTKAAPATSATRKRPSSNGTAAKR